MVRHQTRMITRHAIHRPIGGNHMRIVVTAANRFCVGLLPTRPRGPIERRIVLKTRNVLRRVVEETLAHTVFVWAIVVLQAAPEDSVDELLVFGDLLLVGLAELFHCRCQPGTRTAFVTQPCNPGPTVLRNLLVSFAIVADDRRRPVEWMTRI